MLLSTIKSKSKLLLSFSLALICCLTLLPQGKAEAAYGSWSRVTSTCEVRVWTDYTTYTSSATTIDAFAELKGSCQKYDYKMYVQVYGFAGAISPVQTGWFSSRTPTKYFNLNQLKGSSYTDSVVTIELLQNGRYVGGANSQRLYIHPR